MPAPDCAPAVANALIRATIPFLQYIDKFLEFGREDHVNSIHAGSLSGQFS